MRWLAPCGIDAKVLVGRNRREFITMLGGAVAAKTLPVQATGAATHLSLRQPAFRTATGRIRSLSSTRSGGLGFVGGQNLVWGGFGLRVDTFDEHAAW
jgi:hypothetical protein